MNPNKAFFMFFGATALVVVLVASCAKAGADSGDPAPTVVASSVEIADPPSEGTRLPDIAETVSHTVAWEIADADYSPNAGYVLTGYFRATDAFVQVHQVPVTEQTGSTSFSFKIPSGFPPTPEIVEPYRLFVQLTDDSGDIPAELADSPDAVYERWVFEGDWYDFSNHVSKTIIGGKWYYAGNAPRGSGNFVMDMKGIFQNLPGDTFRYGLTHEWDSTLGETGDWKESEYADEVVEITAAVAGDFLEATDGNGRMIMHHRADPYTFNEPYAGKWWSGEEPYVGGDNGFLLEMADDYLFARRDDQDIYATVGLGPVVAVEDDADSNAGTLTFTATHTREAGGPNEPPFYTLLDTPVTYEVSYVVDPDADPLTLTLTSAEDNMLADSDGREYRLSE